MNGSVFHSTWPVSLFGVRPLIRHALRRATFPVGEGDLPAGTSSRRGSIHRGSALTSRGPLHIRPGLRPVHLPRRGRRPPGGGFLPAGEHSSGLGLNFQGSPPHPARAVPGPPSPSRRGLGRHRGETILSSRNPGSFLPGWGAAASGWLCFRSGGSVLSSRRRSGPPLPGCGSGRRTYRSASAARRLPAR